MRDVTTKDEPLQQLFAPARGMEPGRGRLDGAKVVVVGAGQRSEGGDEPMGNGRAISLICAREGAHVTCVDRDRDSAERTAALIREAGGLAIAVEVDVSQPEQITRFMSEIEGLSGMVMNVGISRGLSLALETAESWDAVMNVNLRAHMLVTQASLQKLEPGGSILLISSLAALSPAGRNPAYEASKAALSALVRAAALDGQERGLRVNALAPGVIDTPMGRAATARRPARTAGSLPFGRQGTAWEVAYAALFLISPEASYVNAQTIYVDGGLGSRGTLTPQTTSN